MNNRKLKRKKLAIRFISSLIFCSTLFLAFSAHCKVIYVDQILGADCLGSYRPENRLCENGMETAYTDLSSGLDAAQPSDIVLLRGGSYGQIAPPKSGVAGSPISIRAYNGEQAKIENLGSAVGITIDQKAHITIDGLTFNNVQGFGHIYDSNYIKIQNCSFSNSTSSGTTGALKFVRSSYCKVFFNRFSQSGSDMLILQDNSDRNVVEANSFDSAVHSLISIRCSGYNAVRSNILRNANQKAVEVYDCEGVSDAPVRLDATKRNLFEGNNFVLTAASDRNYKYNAIQHGGQFTIIRRNVFRNCLGGGVNYQYYYDESLYVYGNRLFNNTFYSNRCYAIIGNSAPSSRYYENRATNNLLYKNTGCDGTDGQVSIDDPKTVILEDNVLATSDPGFVNEAGNNFQLVATSPNVDKGVFITSAVASGSGTTLQVEDAGHFYDGFGIPMEAGDSVQFEGQTKKARIVAINYVTNTLLLEQSLTWSANQGLHLAYTGSSPDVGAFEYGLSPGRPSPPENLRVKE